MERLGLFLIGVAIAGSGWWLWVHNVITTIPGLLIVLLGFLFMIGAIKGW